MNWSQFKRTAALSCLIGGFFSPTTGCAFVKAKSKEAAVAATEAAAKYVAEHKDEWLAAAREYAEAKSEEAKKQAFRKMEEVRAKLEKEAENGSLLAQLALYALGALGLGTTGVKLYRSGRPEYSAKKEG